MKRVLDLGNCDMDHSSICRALDPLGVEVSRAHGADEANALLAEQTFDLVLINRIFDRDGQSGITFIQDLQTNADAPSAMLISNFSDAQEQAVQAGALPGFGKSALHDPATLSQIRSALGAESAVE